ncbi:conserved hypothetical protein [Trichormus variabilis ATCC 29413]|uniref:Uncharacterized protein n=2 Tax=Anabaena variabilis TaxID=264691 RepID=Q3MFY2_TRIV2|nr:MULTISPECIES: hypothetical protein [Nostocaceae]ABA20104.1 conserved hypothetical protein [Trichormus variabilis ATCC 29413]MBC1215147.1 hypothetical protein [Trichormus variabilis ARAD]MBC1257432.1 hypothetical protein [Trichormus variabilis V5]MBC1269773.1 hypothetical protein [Trichormus variabilis FSR]MBC1305182.1 hypothetical protein [Trichormus variabilis N2B]
MVIVVVVFNTAVSVILLYIAWRVWQLKRLIAFIADRLLDYERCSHDLLYKAPENIYLGQQNLQNLRLSNQSLQSQIQQTRQIVSLLLLGQRTWGRYVRKPVSMSEK